MDEGVKEQKTSRVNAQHKSLDSREKNLLACLEIFLLLPPTLSLDFKQHVKLRLFPPRTQREHLLHSIEAASRPRLASARWRRLSPGRPGCVSPAHPAPALPSHLDASGRRRRTSYVQHSIALEQAHFLAPRAAAVRGRKASHAAAAGRARVLRCTTMGISRARCVTSARRTRCQGSATATGCGGPAAGRLAPVGGSVAWRSVEGGREGRVQARCRHAWFAEVCYCISGHLGVHGGRGKRG